MLGRVRKSPEYQFLLQNGRPLQRGSANNVMVRGFKNRVPVKLHRPLNQAAGGSNGGEGWERERSKRLESWVLTVSPVAAWMETPGQSGHTETVSWHCACKQILPLLTRLRTQWSDHPISKCWQAPKTSEKISTSQAPRWEPALKSLPENEREERVRQGFHPEAAGPAINRVEVGEGEGTGLCLPRMHPWFVLYILWWDKHFNGRPPTF